MPSGPLLNMESTDELNNESAFHNQMMTTQAAFPSRYRCWNVRLLFKNTFLPEHFIEENNMIAQQARGMAQGTSTHYKEPDELSQDLHWQSLDGKLSTDLTRLAK